MARAEEDNWSKAVEDLVTSGDTDAAISVLESVISNLENKGLPDSGSPELASALSDLAELYSSKGFSLKADDLQSRASLIKLRHSSSSSSGYITHSQFSLISCLVARNYRKR